MKRATGIFFYLLLVICFSCEEQGWIPKCSDCQSTEPEDAVLEVKLSDSQSQIKITVYEGELEDSVIYFTTDYRGSDYKFSASLNKKFTVTARYFINGNTYTAVDSAIPRVKFTEDQCDDPCYFVYDKILDLRIKYLVYGN